MSLPTRLTISNARSLDYEDLIAACDSLLDRYSPPQGVETEEEKSARLSRTIDEAPEIYRWFLSLFSHFSYWTDVEADINGGRSIDFKMMRNRRDAMENAAKAAKLRYEGASRVITLILDDKERLATSRGPHES